MFGCLGNFLWKSRRIIGEDVHIPITRVSAIVCLAGNIFFLGFWGKFENSIRNLSKTGELSLESNISLCLLLSERSTQGNMRCYKALEWPDSRTKIKICHMHKIKELMVSARSPRTLLIFTGSGEIQALHAWSAKMFL